MINTHNTIQPTDVSFAFTFETGFGDDLIAIFVCINDEDNLYASYDDLRLDHDFIRAALAKTSITFDEAMENTFEFENTSTNILTVLNTLITHGWTYDPSLTEE